MKIKSDFVTNSSSTGYVIMIPEHFNISRDEIINEFYKRDLDINGGDGLIDGLTEDNIYESITKSINELKTGEEIYADEDMSLMIWYTLIEICEIHNMILAGIEMGPDAHTAVGIREKDMIDKLIRNVDITEITKTLIKGANDVTKNKE